MEIVRTRILTRRTAPAVLAAALLTAFLVLFAWPQQASAHDSLLDSSPAADSAVDTLPAELTLTFSAALIPGDGSTEVVVTDADGTSVTDGEPELDGALVTQPLVAEAAAGEYHVLWKVVSSDGHPTSGEFFFTVTTGTGAATAPAENDGDETATDEITTQAPADDPDMAAETSISPAWIIGGIVVLLVAVVIVVLALRGRRRSGGSDGSADSDTPAEG